MEDSTLKNLFNAAKKGKKRFLELLEDEISTRNPKSKLEITQLEISNFISRFVHLLSNFTSRKGWTIFHILAIYEHYDLFLLLMQPKKLLKTYISTSSLRSCKIRMQNSRNALTGCYSILEIVCNSNSTCEERYQVAELLCKNIFTTIKRKEEKIKLRNDLKLAFDICMKKLDFRLTRIVVMNATTRGIRLKSELIDFLLSMNMFERRPEVVYDDYSKYYQCTQHYKQFYEGLEEMQLLDEVESLCGAIRSIKYACKVYLTGNSFIPSLQLIHFIFQKAGNDITHFYAENTSTVQVSCYNVNILVHNTFISFLISGSKNKLNIEGIEFHSLHTTNKLYFLGAGFRPETSGVLRLFGKFNRLEGIKVVCYQISNKYNYISVNQDYMNDRSPNLSDEDNFQAYCTSTEKLISEVYSAYQISWEKKGNSVLHSKSQRFLHIIDDESYTDIMNYIDSQKEDVSDISEYLLRLYFLPSNPFKRLWNYIDYVHKDDLFNYIDKYFADGNIGDTTKIVRFLQSMGSIFMFDTKAHDWNLRQYIIQSPINIITKYMDRERKQFTLESLKESMDYRFREYFYQLNLLLDTIFYDGELVSYLFGRNYEQESQCMYKIMTFRRILLLNLNIWDLFMKLSKYLVLYAKDMKYHFYFFNIFSVAIKTERQTVCKVYSILQINEANVYVPYLYIESDSIELYREFIQVVFHFIFNFYDYNYHVLQRYCDVAYVEENIYPYRTFSSLFRANNNADSPNNNDNNSNVISESGSVELQKIVSPLHHFAEIFTFGSEKKLLQIREHHVLEEDEYCIYRVISANDVYYLQRTWKRKDLYFVYYFIISQVQFYKTVCLFEGNTNVCKLYHYDLDAPNYTTVYSEFGSLETFLEDMKSITLHQMLQVLHRICVIVSQLHAMKFYHLNLSPKAFVVINNDLDLKITRFEKVKNICYYSMEEQYEYHSIEISSFISLIQFLDSFVDSSDDHSGFEGIIRRKYLQSIIENLNSRSNSIMFQEISEHIQKLINSIIEKNSEPTLTFNYNADLKLYIANKDFHSILECLKNHLVFSEDAISHVCDLAIKEDNGIFFRKLLPYIPFEVLSLESSNLHELMIIHTALYCFEEYKDHSSHWNSQTLLRFIESTITLSNSKFLDHLLSLSSFKINDKSLSDGVTPLIFAINNAQNAAVVKLILSYGADPNLPCKQHTPLHLSVLLNQPEIFCLLIEYGAYQLYLLNADQKTFILCNIAQFVMKWESKHSLYPIPRRMKKNICRIFYQCDCNINKLRENIPHPLSLKFSYTSSKTIMMDIQNTLSFDVKLNIFIDNPNPNLRISIPTYILNLHKREKVSLEVFFTTSETTKSQLHNNGVITPLMIMEISYTTSNTNSHRLQYDFSIIELNQIDVPLRITNDTFTVTENTSILDVTSEIVYEELKARDAYQTNLTKYCHKNDEHNLRLLLLSGTEDVNQYVYTKTGWMTAFHIACMRRKQGFIQLLLRFGADPNLPIVQPNGYKLYPLFLLPKENAEFLKFYLENVNIRLPRPEMVGPLIELAIHHAPSITSLSLMGCNIDILPSSIAKLHHLKELDLRSNPIVCLPPQIAFCKDLEKIHLDIPFSQLQNASKDVTDCSSLLFYYKSQLKSEVTMSFMKLIIAGKENNGKTSLVDRMCDRWHKRDSVKYRLTGSGRRISTTGIDISEWPPVKKYRDVIYSIWDFGGQQIYYITHSFFISEKAIYFLVFDLRDEDAQQRIIFWLNTVAIRAPKTRIYIIGTFADKLTSSAIRKVSEEVEVSIMRWKKRIMTNDLKFVLCEQNANRMVWPISNTENKGIKAICDSLMKYGKEMRSEISNKFLMILDELERAVKEYEAESKVPILHYSEFLLLLNQAGINTPLEISSTIKSLCEMGKLLYYPSVVSTDLSDMVIINPTFILKVLKVLLSHKHVGTTIQAGLVNTLNTEKIWKEKGIHPKWFPSLWALLESFHICTKLYLSPSSSSDHNQSNVAPLSPSSSSSSSPNLAPSPQYLIPACVGAAKPDYICGLESLPSIPVRIYRKYDIDFLPPGLFNTISVLFYENLAQIHSSLFVSSAVSPSSSSSLPMLKSSMLLNIPPSILDRIKCVWDNEKHFEIWEDGICFFSDAAKQIQMCVEITPQRSEDMIFRNVILLSVLASSADLAEFALELFCRIHLVIDNIFRDKYPSLHLYHYHQICCMYDPSSASVIDVASRDELLRYYLDTTSCVYPISTSNHSMQTPLRFLIPEILDPTLAYRSTSSKYAMGNFNEVTLEKQLARGNSGEVWLGSISAKAIAIKIYHNACVNDTLIDDFCAEISVMSELEHPNIVKLERFYTSPVLAIAMELMRGNLLSTLEKMRQDSKFLSPTMGLRIALELCRALNYLHSRNPPILHNDFKFDNIMITNDFMERDSLNPWIKLADFGYSRITSKRENNLKKEIEEFYQSMNYLFSIYVSFSQDEQSHHLEDEIFQIFDISKPQNLKDLEGNLLSYLNNNLQTSISI